MKRKLRHLMALLFCFGLTLSLDASPSSACIEKIKELSKVAWSWWRVPEVRKFSDSSYSVALEEYRKVKKPIERKLPDTFEEKLAYLDTLSEHLEEHFHIAGLDFERAMRGRNIFSRMPTATQKFIGRTLRDIDFRNGVSEERLNLALEDLSFLGRGDPYRVREIVKRRETTKTHFRNQTLAVVYEKELLLEALELHGKIIDPTWWDSFEYKHGWSKEAFLSIFYNSDILTTFFPLYFPRLSESSRWIGKDDAATALKDDPEAHAAHQANVATIDAKSRGYGNYMIFRSFANKASLFLLTMMIFTNTTKEMRDDASSQGKELIVKAHKAMADKDHVKFTIDDVKNLRLEIEEARKEHFNKKQVFIAASSLALAIFYLASSRVMTWSARHYLRVFMRLAIMVSLLNGREARIESSQADQIINSLQELELRMEPPPSLQTP